MTTRSWPSSVRCLPKTCWLRLETLESSKWFSTTHPVRIMLTREAYWRSAWTWVDSSLPLSTTKKRLDLQSLLQTVSWFLRSVISKPIFNINWNNLIYNNNNNFPQISGEKMILLMTSYLMYYMSDSSAPAHHVLVIVKYEFGRIKYFLQATAVKGKLNLVVWSCGAIYNWDGSVWKVWLIYHGTAGGMPLFPAGEIELI